MAMSTDTPQSALDAVDVDDIDWRTIFDQYGDEDGRISLMERTDALIDHVDCIQYEEEADDVLQRASERCCVELYGDGEIGLPEDDDDQLPDSAGVDWDDVVDAIPGNTESRDVKRHALTFAIAKAVDGVESDDDAGRLIQDALKCGEVQRKNGLMRLVGASEDLFDEDASQFDEAPDAISDESPQDQNDMRNIASNSDANADDARIRELEKQNEELQHLVEALQTQVKRLTSVVAGEEGLADRLGDTEETFTDLITRVENVEEGVRDNNDKLSMAPSNDEKSSPDTRAVKLRQILTEEVNSGGKARLSRGEAGKALGGGHHRDTVLDAMKRAADGQMAEQPDRPYSEINGSSDLEAVDGITFQTSLTKKKQSYVEIDMTHVTQANLRNNLTTQVNGIRGDDVR